VRFPRRLLLVAAWIAVWIIAYAWLGVARVPLEIGMVLLLYLVIVAPVRAVPVWLLLLLFALGNVVVTWSTAAVQFMLQLVTTHNDDFLGGVIAPITEEIAKILPVVALYAWSRPRLRQSFGASDWMLCGASVGAGVQMWEDVVVGRNGVPPTAPHLFGFPLVTGFMDGGASAFVGHTVSTAFIALAIGWARYLMRPRAPEGSPAGADARRFRRASMFAFTPAAFVLIWMVSDHAGNNLRNAHAWYWALERAVFSLGGRGRIAVYAFLIAFTATVIFETFMMVRGAAALGQRPPARPILERVRWKSCELLMIHQRRYVEMATGVTDPWALYREVRRSEPGWNIGSFVRRWSGTASRKVPGRTPASSD